MPNDERNRNEVGAAWKKTGTRGEYWSVSLDLDALLELTGGATGKVNLDMYENTFKRDNPKAPDYRFKFYPKAGPEGNHARPRRAVEPPLDDDVPY
jgi:uncharacterized protein (DUF736 family)